MWSMDVATEEVNTEYICTAIAPMYDPFQNYSVKKGQFVRLFWIEWLEIQTTLMQTIQRMMHITQTRRRYCLWNPERYVFI